MHFNILPLLIASLGSFGIVAIKVFSHARDIAKWKTFNVSPVMKYTSMTYNEQNE